MGLVRLLSAFVVGFVLIFCDAPRSVATIATTLLCLGVENPGVSVIPETGTGALGIRGGLCPVEKRKRYVYMKCRKSKRLRL